MVGRESGDASLPHMTPRASARRKAWLNRRAANYRAPDFAVLADSGHSNLCLSASGSSGAAEGEGSAGEPL